MSRRFRLHALALLVLLHPTAAAADCVRSRTHPIEVCTVQASDVTIAKTCLTATEDVWEILIDGAGFSTPYRLDAMGTPELGIRVEIGPLGGNVGYVEILTDVPATPHSDCAVVAHMELALPDYYIPIALAHELGHALTAADDCVEPATEAISPYLELVTVQSMGLLSLDDYLEGTAAFTYGEFQSMPWLALDAPGFGQGYHYGHSLLSFFLDVKWGEGDASLVARLSKATRQNGTIERVGYGAVLVSGENEPDYNDAVDTVLEPFGVTFWDAMGEFAVWRLLTGSRSDAQHFPSAAVLPEATIDTMLTSLPQVDLHPTNPPQETGTSYIGLTLDPSTATDTDVLTFSLASSDAANWAVWAVVMRAGGVEAFGQRFAGGSGTLHVGALVGASRLFFAVTNLGDLDHDPDHLDDFEAADFSYSIERVAAPQLTSVTPAIVEQGAQGVILTVVGANLDDTQEFALGDGLTIVSVEVVSAERVLLTVDVAADAVLGARDLEAGFVGMPPSVLPNAVEVVSAQPIVSSMSPDKGRVGTTVEVTFTGSNFRDEVACDFGDGVAASVTKVDATHLEVRLELAANAVLGLRDVRVTNPGAEALLLLGAFEVLGDDVAETALEGSDVSAPTAGNGDCGGCGCQTVGHEVQFGLLPLLALLGLLWLRRR